MSSKKVNKTMNIESDIYQMDRMMPQAVEAEMMVLGVCLCYPDSVYEVQTHLSPEMFYKDSHRKIYAAIMELAGKSVCDIVTVTELLRKKNELEAAGGVLYITTLTERVVTDKYIMDYVTIIKEKYLLREYIRIGRQISEMSFSEDLQDVVEFAENNLFNVSTFIQVKEPRRIDKCIDAVLTDVDKISKNEKKLSGVPSGFTSIDRVTGGWQPGNLIIIAGRPSMGKTAFALSLAVNAARLEFPVCMFSLEMSESEISTRLLSGASGYTSVEIRCANLDYNRLLNSSYEIANLPFYVDDTPALSLYELRSKVKKAILKHNVRLVIVDYLQLMRAEADSREQEVSIISRGLKAISKEFNIPVIALSQLNRDVESRADKRPHLADLRESGSIEQDADIVCFVYRPELYKIKVITFDKKEIPSKNKTIIDCAKNRNGSLFSTVLQWNDTITNIQEEIF